MHVFEAKIGARTHDLEATGTERGRATLGVNRNARRRARALVDAIRYAITVRIQRATLGINLHALGGSRAQIGVVRHTVAIRILGSFGCAGGLRTQRSEEHTSELQSLMRISYAVFCLKK